MSKASEYAAKMDARHRRAARAPTFSCGDWTCAYVSGSGQLELLAGTLTPPEALALAAWIVETFGEGTK